MSLSAPWPVARASATLAAALLLVACHGGREPPHPARPAAPPIAQPPPPPREPTVAGSEALWHLRAGLNVAALECRLRGTDMPRVYRSFLARHRVPLEAAWRAEEARHGARGADRHMTAVYNRFAGIQPRLRFCERAASVAERANALPPAVIDREARALLGELGG